MYCLPPEFYGWSQEERVEWHRRRVEREESVYRMLESMGLYSPFDEDELRDRLKEVRKLRKRVEAALFLAENSEFLYIQKKLKGMAIELGNNNRERASILQRQFRRVKMNSTREERDQLEVLRLARKAMLEDVEGLEKRMVALCNQYGVDPEPHLVTPTLKG